MTFDPQLFDPIRSARIRVRSAAAVRYRFYVRSVLVAAALICVAAGAIVVDRSAHPIRPCRVPMLARGEPDATGQHRDDVRVDRVPIGTDECSGDHGTYPIRSQCLTIRSRSCEASGMTTTPEPTRRVWPHPWPGMSSPATPDHDWLAFNTSALVMVTDPAKRPPMQRPVLTIGTGPADDPTGIVAWFYLAR